MARKFTSGTEGPDIPFPKQVENWIQWSASTSGDPRKIATALTDPTERESLRDYTEACIGLPVTETDIVQAIQRMTVATDKHSE